MSSHVEGSAGPAAGNAPDETAAVVVAVWCELFGVSRVEPGDDFFALGGHSMLAVRMASRLRAEPGLGVPVLRRHDRLSSEH